MTKATSGELKKPPADSQLYHAEIAQPLCTAIQIALIHTFRRVGVTPSAVIGHSSGEIPAAYACGALSLRAALIVAYYRGLVTKESSKNGGMAAIGLGANEVSSLLHDGVVIACENSWSSTTISGDVNSLNEILSCIKQLHPETLVRKLRVDMAYHSRESLFSKTAESMLKVSYSPHDTTGQEVRSFNKPGTNARGSNACDLQSSALLERHHRCRQHFRAFEAELLGIESDLSRSL